MKKINFKSLIRPKFFWASIVVLLLITSTTFYLLKEEERKEKIFTQKQLVKTIEAKKVVEFNLTKTFRAKEIVEQKFDTERKRTTALEKEVEDKENQISFTLDKLEKEVTARREAEAQLLIAVREKRTLKAELKKFTKATETIELEKIVVKSTSSLIGEVLMVNKEHNFIVVDLGRASNLGFGDLLSIYRDDEFIGKAEVERVNEKTCAAAILPDWQDVEFKENDEARRL
ncbi:MAG: hypothetical protein KKG01_03125 [Candidatus Omnitrophica bacterium]|nr:hypothetical protein [Candidatus Omnitrophota bacterium]